MQIIENDIFFHKVGQIIFNKKVEITFHKVSQKLRGENEM